LSRSALRGVRGTRFSPQKVRSSHRTGPTQTISTFLNVQVRQGADGWSRVRVHACDVPLQRVRRQLPARRQPGLLLPREPAGRSAVAADASRRCGAGGAGRCARRCLPRRSQRAGEHQPGGARRTAAGGRRGGSSTYGRGPSSPQATFRAPSTCRRTRCSSGCIHCPKSQDVVAYCRGPYCVYADDAVGLLTSTGAGCARRVSAPETGHLHRIRCTLHRKQVM